jgi:hypothetical protein
MERLEMADIKQADDGGADIPGIEPHSERERGY